MKYFLILFTAFVWLAVPLGCRASEEELIYTIINGRAVITGFRGEPEFLEIPQYIESCKVTEIKLGAFYGCSSLKRIALPPTLEKIGENSFYACYSLEEVIIPDSVVKIGNGCFCGCTSLSSVTIPLGISEIPVSCFRACVKLETVNIPYNIHKIGAYAFSGCTGLKTVTLGEELKEISERAFFMCDSLEKLYIPSSLTLLEKEAVGYGPSNQGAAPMTGFELSGRKGSAAEKYASECGMKFIPSRDIIRTAASFHPSLRSEKVSEVCVSVVMLVFIAAAAANATGKRKCKK